MELENKELTECEKKWMELILSKNFLHRDEVINQINYAKVIREYTDYYLALKFDVEEEVQPVRIRNGVPVEMRVYKKDCMPVQFLLHITRGYVSELEIFKADSSNIKAESSLADGEVEILLNPEVVC